jgi:hypothetical protein
MAVHRRQDSLFADSQSDLPEVLRDFSEDGYPATHFADASCSCGCRTFQLAVDDDAGVAIRTCTQCGNEQPICDSGEYLDEAELQYCQCLCDSQVFEITVGVALYADSEDVRWLYVGCRCPACGLSGCYGDWKNEFPDYRELLSRV